LRERREDIPEMVAYFVKKFSAQSGKMVGLSKTALQILQSRAWDGNVRELEHTIERAVALTRGGEDIQPEYCTDDFSGYHSAPAAALPDDGLHLPTYLNNLEREMVVEALQRMNGSQTRAAALLQIPVHAYRHLLAKHNLQSNTASKDKSAGE
jgi:DNA-binding NtrC family response regulator